MQLIRKGKLDCSRQILTVASFAKLCNRLKFIVEVVCLLFIIRSLLLFLSTVTTQKFVPAAAPDPKSTVRRQHLFRGGEGEENDLNSERNLASDTLYFSFIRQILLIRLITQQILLFTPMSFFLKLFILFCVVTQTKKNL